jgi:two-component SAPR family response regulator
MNLTIQQMEAISKLYPQAVIIKGDIAYDVDGNEVQYDKTAVEAEVQANAYKGLRAAEYPAIVDQLDTIFHDGLDAWKAQIQAVKDKYPKA